jgi:hypothetical protein
MGELPSLRTAIYWMPTERKARRILEEPTPTRLSTPQALGYQVKDAWAVQSQCPFPTTIPKGYLLFMNLSCKVEFYSRAETPSSPRTPLFWPLPGAARRQLKGFPLSALCLLPRGFLDLGSANRLYLRQVGVAGRTPWGLSHEVGDHRLHHSLASGHGFYGLGPGAGVCPRGQGSFDQA